MGLFDKKYCDICGEKIGLFGTRKLEDGKMCKDCAKKLSPWFDDRRHSTLNEIKEQLQYREENRNAVQKFRSTLDLGENYRVRIDEESGTFMVTQSRRQEDMLEENPDVFRLSQVKDARMDISDTRTELYTEDREGNKRSYDPPRYRYTYRFYLEIDLDHPYADHIRFQLNNYPVEIERADRGFSLFGDSFNPDRDYDYSSYKRMGEDIVKNLKYGSRKTAAREEAPAPAAPVIPEVPAEPQLVVCPYCGSRVKNGKFCSNCGGHLE